MNPHKVEALRKALDEWQKANHWASNYRHEDVLGEYTRKLKQAEENLLRAAQALLAEQPAPLLANGGGYQPGQRVRILPGDALTDALVGREVEVVGDDRGLGRVRVAEVGQAMVHYVLRELVKP
jgi:hypothetical protein